LIVHMITTA